MRTSLYLGSIAVLSLFGSILAVQSGEKDKGPDANFVLKSSESNLVEIELGKLAQKQSSNDRVREFGAKMAKDHGKTSDELADIAKKNGFAMAKEASKEHKDMCEKLKKISGADFDRQYMTGQVKAHRSAVKLFTDQAKNGQNADLRSFASKTLPTIEEHLKMAEEIARTLDKSN